MSKKTSETIKLANSIPFPVLELFNGPAASAVSQNSDVLAKGIQVIPSQLGEFVATRIKANAKLYSQCTDCTDWSELMDIQQKWLQDMSQAYNQQANAIMSMAQSLFEQTEKKTPAPDNRAPEKTRE